MKLLIIMIFNRFANLILIKIIMKIILILNYLKIKFFTNLIINLF